MTTYTLDDLEEMEEGVDTPEPPHTTGRSRPQALRQARARRSSLISRLTFRG